MQTQTAVSPVAALVGGRSVGATHTQQIEPLTEKLSGALLASVSLTGGRANHVADQREGKRVLHLVAFARKPDRVARAGSGRKPLDETCLADPGVALDQDGVAAVAFRCAPGLDQRRPGVGAPHERQGSGATRQRFEAALQPLRVLAQARRRLVIERVGEERAVGLVLAEGATDLTAPLQCGHEELDPALVKRVGGSQLLR